MGIIKIKTQITTRMNKATFFATIVSIATAGENPVVQDLLNNVDPKLGLKTSANAELESELPSVAENVKDLGASNSVIGLGKYGGHNNKRAKYSVKPREKSESSDSDNDLD